MEKFPFLALARNTIMLQHLIIHFSFHYMSSGRLREVENKGKFQTLSSKSGLGHLREVVAYERWSLTRGGRLREVVAYKRFKIN